MPGVNLDVSNHKSYSKVNGTLPPDGLRGVLECKDYRYLDIVSPFVLGCVDTWMALEDNPPLTKIHIQHTELSNRLMSKTGLV